MHKTKSAIFAFTRLTIGVGFVLIYFLPFETQASWFDVSWNYRRDYPISYNAPTALTEYQVFIENLDTASLIAAGKMKSGCEDIRFTNNADAVVLPHFLLEGTCNTSNTRIWVRVDDISTNMVLHIYYGNPAASDTSSEVNTFSYTAEKTIGYVLHSAVDRLEVISLATGVNLITHNGNTLSLNQYQTGFFDSINRFAPIKAKGLFNADDSSDNTDMFVPISWAGVEFHFLNRAVGNVVFSAIAPWEDAQIKVYGVSGGVSGANLGCDAVISSSGNTVTCSSEVGHARVVADAPILMFGYSGTVTDPTPIKPATLYDWLGSGSSTVVINATSTLDYRYIYDNTTTVLNNPDLAINSYVGLSGDANFGGGGLRVWSADNNFNFSVMQYADGDGSDAHFYGDITEQGTVFGSANTADYISIASTNSSECSVFDSSGAISGSPKTLTSSNTLVYFGGFGTGSSGPAITTGWWYMTCTKPVIVSYQKVDFPESNLMTYALMRQYTYPAPLVGSPGVELLGPLDPPQALFGAPVANPYPQKITWSWGHGANPSDGSTTYFIYLETAPGIFVFWGLSNSNTVEMETDTLGQPLRNATQYTARVKATHALYTDSDNSEASATTIARNCTNGSECRKGEVCYDHDNDNGAVTQMICVDFNKCVFDGAACYLSACDDLGADCHVSPGGRDFTATQGFCSTLPLTDYCDLPRIAPNSPSVCLSGGVNCTSAGPGVAPSTLPYLQWLDSDAEETFTDYRTDAVSYPGASTEYQVQMQRTIDVKAYNFNTANAPDLAPGVSPARFLDFANLAGGPQYLDFDTEFKWKVKAFDPGSPPPFEGYPLANVLHTFTTQSVCDVLQYDYSPPNYFEGMYAPNQTPDNPNVVYPNALELSWEPPASLIASGVLKGPGAGSAPTYQLRMQECNFDGSACLEFLPGGGFTECQVKWGCKDMETETSYSFGGANPLLKFNKTYKWTLLVNHGLTYATFPVQTLCTATLKRFKTAEQPRIVLQKRLINLRDQDVAYRIDFSFEGLSGTRIRNFYITDSFGSQPLINPSDADDIFIKRNPDSLQIIARDSSPSLITWYIEDTAAGFDTGGGPRVTSGLVALYEFNELGGNGIADTSGFGAPLNLSINNPASVTWVSGGLLINSGTIIRSPAAGTKVINAIQSTNEITIEAWLQPANLTQTGPARIVTLSQSNSLRNFTLGQSGTSYQGRFRTTTNSLNGDSPLLTSSGAAISLAHLVYTRDSAGVAKIYINNVQTANRSDITGDVSNWDATMPFALANEISLDRPWLGRIYLVAIYNRDLSAAEIAQNYNAGPENNGIINDASIDVGATGSLVLTLQEQQSTEECTFIDNTASGRGKDMLGNWTAVSESNSVSHLAGSQNIDTGFLVTENGNIHSNAFLCFRNAPVDPFYLGEYLVTANHSFDVTGNLIPILKYSAVGTRYSQSSIYVRDGMLIDLKPTEPGFADIDYNKLYTLANSAGVVVFGECDVSTLFGAANVALGNKVYACRSGSGVSDFNGDGVSTNGDLVIDQELTFIHSGKPGTIVVDGNLYIDHDILFSDPLVDPINDITNLAAVGFVVRGNIYIKEYPLEDADNCSVTPPGNWCAQYSLVEQVLTDPDGAEGPIEPYLVDALAFGPMTVGPDTISGTYFAEGNIYTGRIHLPLQVNGSLIANDVILERLVFPQN